MAIDAETCHYCKASLSKGSKRCKDCGSWLDWRSHLLYPETLWVLIALLISVIAAAVAVNQAADARSERRAVEALRKDISVVATNITKMAFVVADGSGKFDGFPDVHLAAIKRYEEAMRPYLPPELDTNIQATIRDLNEQIHKRIEKH